jgi:hypothetical protein
MFALSVDMKTVIIVSKCLRVTKFNAIESLLEFHFRGVYAGQEIKKVMLRGKMGAIHKNEEYLLYVRLFAIENGVLKGEILKHKRLEECWDQS